MIDDIKLKGYKELLKAGIINQDTIYNHVAQGKITPQDYKNITNEDCPELPIEIVKQHKIQELSEICEWTIINEFYSDCLGAMLHFGCRKDEDQPWIMGRYFKAQSIIQSNPELADVPLEELAWKNQDANECFPFTPTQMLKLGEDMEVHLINTKNKFYALRAWILDENRTFEELEYVTWDSEIEQ